MEDFDIIYGKALTLVILYELRQCQGLLQVHVTVVVVLILRYTQGALPIYCNLLVPNVMLIQSKSS